MGSAQLAGFFGIKSGVNSAKNYVGSALARQVPNFVAAQRIGGVNADADGVSGLNALRIHLAEGFIDKDRVAEALGSGAGENVLPARSDDCSPERHVARVDQMNVHAQCSFVLRISPNSFTSH